MRSTLFRARATTLMILLLTVAAAGQAQRRQPAENNATPRLVVVITVDQLRQDYLQRFKRHFAAGGFNRLLNRGAVFVNAHYDYVPTYTAPGHASIFTGSVPAYNGIVGNNWYDREAGRVRVMVSDTEARTVTAAGVSETRGSSSARTLIGATVGDQMRLANNLKSKVVAMSFKDRSAILPGGRRPNGAFWFDNTTGGFVTSDYYSDVLPEWVKRFNATDRPDQYFGAVWDRLLPAAAYEASQQDRLSVQRSPVGTAFPYRVTGGEQSPGRLFYNAFQYTPFASEYLSRFARAAVEAESLGADSYPDLLAIGFSQPDLLGHSFGPDSPEVQDTFVRLDRVIADLLDFLDRRIGLANVVVVLTSDHGVGPVPERLASLGFEAGRISPRRITEAVDLALAARFGGEKWVLALVNDQIHLDHNQIRERKLDASEVERVAGEAALGVPGIARYVARTRIMNGGAGGDPVTRRIVAGFNPNRSGDVCLVANPFWLIMDAPIAASHGTGYSYDTHVPVILFGGSIRPGKYDVECAPSDIAPTIAAILGVTPPPQSIGRVLPVIKGHHQAVVE